MSTTLLNVPAASLCDADPLEASRNEVLRRIGRNVWLFQGIEGQLKWLVHVSFADGPPRELESRHAERAARVSRKTLGTLVGELFEDVVTHEPRTARDSSEDFWLSFSLRMDQDSGFSEKLRSDLATIVAERNELVHHAVKRWDLTSLDSLRAALGELDGQRERIMAVRAELTRLIDMVKTSASEMVVYLASDEFRGAFWSAHLNACLLDAVARAARADGWTPLDRVGQLFREHVIKLPAERQAEIPKLHVLLQTSGLFELQEEPTPNGGRRLMCRLRPDSVVAVESP